jgi:hypothetical protein
MKEEIMNTLTTKPHPHHQDEGCEEKELFCVVIEENCPKVLSELNVQNVPGVLLCIRVCQL